MKATAEAIELTEEAIQNLRVMYPQLPEGAKVWIVSVVPPAVGFTRTSPAMDSQREKQTQEAFESATQNIPDDAIVLMQTPLRGIDPDYARAAIEMHSIMHGH